LDVLSLSLAVVVLAALPGQAVYISCVCMGRWSCGAWKCWHWGNLGNLLRATGKYTYSCAVHIGAPVTKIGKGGLFGLNWAVWLDNKFCKKS